jgi:hypothetical protein
MTPTEDRVPGPIETELRAKADIVVHDWKAAEAMSPGAMQVCRDASKSVKRAFNYFSLAPGNREVLSEAIEAAMALGL